LLFAPHPKCSCSLTKLSHITSGTALPVKPILKNAHEQPHVSGLPIRLTCVCVIMQHLLMMSVPWHLILDREDRSIEHFQLIYVLG
jgi:hypothetical protein